MKNQMKDCPWCGKALAEPGAKFCNECGHRLTRSAGPAPVAVEEEDPFLREAGALDIRSRGPKAPAQEPPQLLEQAIRRSEERLYSHREEPTPDVAFRIEAEREQLSKAGQNVPFPRELREEDEYQRVGAVITDQAEGEPRRSGRPKRRKKQPGRGRTLVTVLCVVLVMALLGGGAFGLMYLSKNGPKKAAAQFAQALAQGDVVYIQSHLAMSDKAFANADSVSKLCQALAATVPQKTLEAHLAALDDSAAVGYNPQLNCLAMVKSGGLLGGKYYLEIDWVPVAVETQVGEVTFLVDGVAMEPTPGEGDWEGSQMLYLLPGNHTIQAVAEVGGMDYPLGEEQISAFSTETRKIRSFTKEEGSVRIELAGTETNLQVLVDGKDAGLKAKRGMVIVEPSFKDMAITLTCDQYTQEIKATGGRSQQVAVEAIAKAEAEPVPKNPEEMTNRQLMDAVAPQYFAFYTSYLEATNKWDPKLVTNLYAGYADVQMQKMTNYNQGLLFELIWIKADRESIVRGKLDDGFTVAFYVETKTEYQYKDKDDKQWYAGGNKQEVTMRYNEKNKKWELCASKMNDELTLSENLLTYDPE